jgi:hypothetical protein
MYELCCVEHLLHEQALELASNGCGGVIRIFTGAQL